MIGKISKKIKIDNCWYIKKIKNNRILCKSCNHTIAIILKATIATKLKNRGIIAILNELLRYLFHFSDAEKISFRERRAISPTTIAAPYWGSPGVVIIDIALDAAALETMLDEILLNNIITPSTNKTSFLNVKDTCLDIASSLKEYYSLKYKQRNSIKKFSSKL